MITSKQEALDSMRSDIYTAIRRNLLCLRGHISRHHVVEILATILSGQIDIIKDNVRHPTEDPFD